MTTLELLNKVQSLNTDQVIQTTMEGTKEQIADLNIEQLRQGFSKSGERFSPYRNEEYAAMKNQLNPLPGFGNPDYILTGAFSSRIQATATEDGYQITSTDPKLAKLIARDPSDLPIGLSPVTHEKALNEVVRPYFKQEITAAAGLKFN